MKLTLHRKLVRGFILILSIVLGLEMIHALTAYQARQELGRLIEEDLQVAHLFGNIERNATLAYAQAISHAAEATIETMEQSEIEMATLDAEVATQATALQAALSRADEQDLLGEFVFAWDVYTRLRHEQVLPASAAGRKDDAVALLLADGSAGMAARNALDKLAKLQQLHRTTRDNSMRASQSRHALVHKALLAATFALLLPVLAFVGRLGAQVAEPVQALAAAARLVASGETEWSVALDTGDELEELAESLNRMTRIIKRQTVAQQEMMEKLTSEVHERQRASQALDAMRERLALALDGLDVGVIVAADGGSVRFINGSAARLTGWGQKQVGGRSIDDVLRGAPDPISALLQPDGLPQRLVIQTRFGGNAAVLCVCTSWPTANGEPPGLLLLLRGIVEPEGPPARNEAPGGQANTWAIRQSGRSGDILW